jgi:hypothetical protein
MMQPPAMSVGAEGRAITVATHSIASPWHSHLRLFGTGLSDFPA